MGIDLDHFAIALRNVGPVLNTLVGELGARVLHGGASIGFRAMQLDCGDLSIELLEPHNVEMNDFLERFLQRSGEGPHHMTFKTDDIRRELDRVRAAGYEPVGVNIDNPWWKEAFLHPKDALGIVVQLAQAAGKGPTRGKWRTAPPGPANPPPPVRLLGLRTRAQSGERAERQWGGLLQGRAGREDGLLVYRWPDSPLRIAVEIAPTAAEGPTQIDVVSPRPIEPLDTADTVLGTAFVPHAEL